MAYNNSDANRGSPNLQNKSMESPKLFYQKPPVIYDAPSPNQSQNDFNAAKRVQSEGSKVKVNWNDPNVFSVISQEVNRLEHPPVYNQNAGMMWPGHQPVVTNAYISPPMYGTNTLNTGYNTYNVTSKPSPNQTYPVTPNINSQVYNQNYNIPPTNTLNSLNNPNIVTPRWEEIEYQRKLKEEEAKRKEEELKKKKEEEEARRRFEEQIKREAEERIRQEMERKRLEEEARRRYEEQIKRETEERIRQEMEQHRKLDEARKHEELLFKQRMEAYARQEYEAKQKRI